ncbi:ATP phosphoribosyltransferase regulatory subunit [Leptospira wolffii]|uniref:ATP phosphoribosyltransferase regulatory subunit n=1 Tax=Leptospira wolffii TaxID=409998 RepID=UPI0010825120|nr:ATP phosphoribosyltransferase regulatory subunit [Leptospira wolffii]TGK58288.1 ATP phosphoribosyltransferase regulatory subunit [Leptospira wolffii]TGK66335.1 ATP phosphoribosyltransferase regulatory subunit [Leptospira wolffii]TGK68966.1 ATP phosphoribosyltransferase regulatory subunit [Leptospira wolffii]TGL27318.1 ATP phosphoribosyltransferase regulatory subunit [Leptospira wolffii]
MSHNPPEFSEKKWIPDGFHFLGPNESSERRKLLDSLSGDFRKFGYSEVFLPSFDYSSSFLLTVANEDSGSLYRFRDSDGNEISPSADLTVQAVKGMAGFAHRKENQRIFYQGKIFRDYGRKSGTRKEILQLGAENLGGSGTKAILGILGEVSEIFSSLSLDSTLTIVLGNVNLFHSLLESLGLSQAEKRQLSFLLYRKNLPEIRGFLESRNGLEIFPVLEALCLGFSSDEDLGSRFASLGLSDSFRTVLRETGEILNSLPKRSSVEFCADYTLIPDLEYYTGFVFQGYVSGNSEPVLTGGAYDHLYERFSGLQKDACGFAINVDVLETVLKTDLDAG